MCRAKTRNVVLISKDEALASLCRAVLAETFGAEWTLAVGPNGHETSMYDLCIWDFSSEDLFLPRDFGPAQIESHFFLVHKDSLAAFRDLPGSGALNVVLKPVTRASLRAFLSGAGQYESQRGHGHTVPVGALRAERDQMLQFLIHANLKLQEYDQERTNFLARSIHDFRAPLTALSGYCALALEEELGPLTAELREVIEKMQQSANRMSRIAKAMFQLSTDQRLEQEPQLELGEVRDCVDQALYELGPFLSKKQLVTSLDIAPSPEGLLFEKTQLEQVLVNLLENACKFTPRGGSIDVKGYPFFWNRRIGGGAAIDPILDRRVRQLNRPNAFRVDIRDSGPGIPTSHVERIFEEYTSYSGGEDRSGGGLGLAICRMIIERHQGRIWAESNSQGAVFSFVLPLRSEKASAKALTNGSCSEQSVGKAED